MESDKLVDIYEEFIYQIFMLQKCDTGIFLFEKQLLNPGESRGYYINGGDCMKLEKKIENELRTQISKKLPKDSQIVNISAVRLYGTENVYVTQYQYVTKDKQLH